MLCLKSFVVGVFFLAALISIGTAAFNIKLLYSGQTMVIALTDRAKVEAARAAVQISQIQQDAILSRDIHN